MLFPPYCFFYMFKAGIETGVTCNHTKSDCSTDTKQKRLDSQYSSNEFESSQIDKGWEYLKMDVINSPSTAELVSYIAPDEAPCKAIEKDINMPGLSVVSYQVSAKNGSGIVDEETFVVFFINGEPILGDAVENVKTESASSIRTRIKYAQAPKK